MDLDRLRQLREGTTTVPLGETTTAPADTQQAADPDTQQRLDKLGQLRNKAAGQDRTLIEVNTSSDPSAARRAKQVEEKTGLPEDLAEADPQSADQLERIQQLEELAGERPGTRSILLDPTTSRYVHDDTGFIADMEDAVGATSRAVQRGTLRIRQGAEQLEAEQNQRIADDSKRSFGEIFSDATSDPGIVNPVDIFSSMYRFAVSRIYDADAAAVEAQESLQDAGRLAAEAGQLQMSQSAQEMMQKLEKANEEDGWLGISREIITNPIQTLGLGGEVGLEFLPQVVAAGVASRVAGPGAGMAIMGMGSAATERFSSPLQIFQEAGYDVSKPEDARAVLNDPELMQAAKDYGFTRGAIIGSIDAVTGGLASRTFGGTLRNFFTQAGIQMAGGGGGEALATIATGRELNNVEIALEMIGELSMTPIDIIALGANKAAEKRNQRKAAKRAVEYKERIGKLVDAAGQTKIMREAPEVFQKVIERITTNTDMEEIQVSAAGLKAFSDAAGTPQAAYVFFGEAGIDEKTVQDAIIMGHDVTIPTHKYVEAVTKQAETDTSLRDAVIANTRANSKEATFAEAEAYMEQDAADMAAQAQATVDVADMTEEELSEFEATQLQGVQDALRSIETAVLEQAKEAGVEAGAARNFISMLSSIFETESRARSAEGVSSADLIQSLQSGQMTPSIQREVEAIAEGLRQDVQADAEQFGVDAVTLQQELDAVGGDLTQTPAFKAWFGDSKVVDENGDPLVVYHGAAADFEAFDPARVGTRDQAFYGLGYYLTDDIATAEEYAFDHRSGEEGVVMEAHVSIENPFVFDLSENGLPGTVEALRALGVNPRSRVDGDPSIFNLVADEPRKFTRAAKAAGHDGVIVLRYGTIDEVVAFEPTQIKSVFNRGTFDPTDPRILHQELMKRAKFDQDFARWRELASASLSGRGETGEGRTLRLGRTTPVMRAVGLPNRQLIVSESKLRRIKREHPTVPDEVFLRLPELIANPLLVVEGGSQNEKQVLLDAVDTNGDRIIAAIKAGVDSNGNEAGVLLTVTPLDQPTHPSTKNFDNALLKGDILYARDGETLRGQRSNAVTSVTSSGRDAPPLNPRRGTKPKTLTDVMQEYGGSYLYQQRAPIDPNERIADRAPPRPPRGGTYMGVVADYTIENPNTDAPRIRGNAPMIQASTNAANAEAQSAALDVLLNTHKNPLSSERAWADLANDAFSLDRLPMPPFRTLELVKKGAKAIEKELSGLSDGMRRDAEEGLKTAKAFGKLYASGDVTPDITAKAFLWSFLSRGVSPYVQEGAFLDAIMSDEMTAIMQEAAEKGWSQQLEDRYAAWAATAIPEGSPGRGTQHNLNAFGRNFLRVMTQKHEDADGRTGLQIIHDMIADGTPSYQIRREFLRRGDRAGIDNKVVSFTLLLLGRTDVLVLDRVQVRNQFNDGRFDGQNIYDSAKDTDGNQVTGTAFAEMTFGHKGLLYYEAMERALKPIVEKAYANMGMEGSLGRYHWDSWLLASNQEVGHASVDGLLRDASGKSAPYVGAFVRQGKYAQYDYGFRYGVLPDNTLGTVVETLSEDGAVLLPYDVVADVKGPLRKAINKLKTAARKRGTEYGTTKPWTAALTQEERETYDQALKSSGSAAPDGWKYDANAVGRDAAAGGRDDVVEAANATYPRPRRDQAGRAQDGLPGGRRGDDRAYVVELNQLAPEQADLFHQKITEAVEAMGPIGAAVEIKTVEELAEGTMLLSEDGMAGVMIKPDGDITSVFKHPDGAPGAVLDIIEQAVLAGGRKLDAFDGYLPTRYAKAGFVPESRIPWVEEFAPDGWDKAAMEYDGNKGEPDVVFMRYSPETATEYVPGTGQMFEDYDAAAEHRDGRMRQDVLEQGEGIQGAFNPQTLAVRLFRDDLSTLLHEGGHLYVELLQRVADLPDASQRTKDNLRAMLDWVGAEDAAELDLALYGEAARDKQERLAEAFEAYLMEGKAPSAKLRRAFAQFRAWLLQVYRSITSTRTLTIEIDDTIRSVFDRLLATDQEIAEQSLINEMGAVSMTPELRDLMTPEEQSQHDMLEMEANAAAAEERAAREAIAAKKAEQAAYQQALREARVEAEENVYKRPEYAALWFLTRGTFKDGDTPKSMINRRLDKRELLEVFTQDELSRLPRHKGRGIYTDDSDQATPIDVLAPVLGFENGSELMYTMMRMRPVNDVIEEEARRMTQARMGDPYDGKTVAELTEEAIYNKERRSAIELEMQAVARAAGASVPSKAAIDQLVSNIMAQLPMKDLVSPNRFIAAAVRSAKAAGRAEAKGDYVTALEHKRKQLLNHELARKVIAEGKRIKTRLDYLRKFSKTGKWEGIEASYLDAIRQITQAYRFGSDISDNKRNKLGLEALAAWRARSEKYDGAIFVLPPELLEADSKPHWKTMTMDHFNAIYSAVKNIDQQGRNVKKTIRQKEEIERKLNVSYMLLRMDELETTGRMRRASESKPGLWDGVYSVLAKADAAMLKAGFLLEFMDGGPDGPAQKAFYDPFAQAEKDESTKVKEFGEKFSKAFEALPKHVKKDLNKVRWNPALGRNASRAELIHIALNTGNDSNFAKMIEGSRKSRQNKRPLTEDGVLEALKQLTAEEIAFVNTVWTLFEDMRDDVGEVWRSEQGEAPAWMDPRELDLPNGTLTGGYIPMMYDPTDSVQGEKIDTMDALSGLQSEEVQATVFSGMTKARTGFSAPVLLDLTRIPGKLQETAHFITHYQAVRNANKLLADSELEQAIVAKFGPEYYTSLRNWIGHIASNGRNTQVQAYDIFGQLTEHMRNNATVSIMGVSMTTILTQPLGVFTSIDTLARGVDGKVKPGRGALRMLEGYLSMLMPGRNAEAVKMSTELRDRRENADREIRHALGKIRGIKGKKAAWQRLLLVAIPIFQYFAVDLPTWHAAYAVAMNANYNSEDAARFADRTINKTQGGGSPKDLSAIQTLRGTPRALTMFMTFFSTLYAIQRRLAREREWSGDYAYKLFVGSFTVYVLPSIIEGIFRLESPDPEDDPEEYAKWLAIKSLMFAGATVPVARDIVSGVGSHFGYSPTPLAGAGDAVVSAVDEAYDIATGEDDVGPATLRTASSLMGWTLGVFPSTQFNRVVRTWEKLDETGDVSWWEWVVGPDKSED